MEAIFGVINGIVDQLPIKPHCPECGDELSRIHDYNPEYKATFCNTCYDWVPMDDEVMIDTSASK